jgi:hypothetical protein
LGAKDHQYSVERNPNIFSQLEKLDVESLIEGGKKQMKIIDDVINENLKNKFKVINGNVCYSLVDQFGRPGKSCDVWTVLCNRYS